jgi:hypothetical protein
MDIFIPSKKMKKIISVLSILMLLSVENLSPFAFVLADSVDEENVVEEEMQQEDSQEQEFEVLEEYGENSEDNQ